METRSLPEAREEEVLVKVLAVGICAGDAKCYAGAPYFWGKPRSCVRVAWRMRREGERKGVE